MDCSSSMIHVTSSVNVDVVHVCVLERERNFRYAVSFQEIPFDLRYDLRKFVLAATLL